MDCSAAAVEMSLLLKDLCVGGGQSSCCSQVGDWATFLLLKVTKAMSGSPWLWMKEAADFQMNESFYNEAHT